MNMYENYPFWHRFFTEFGFEVVLSDPSSKKIFEIGIETIPSEVVCYPAKLDHGHMMNLIDKGLKRSFILRLCLKSRKRYASKTIITARLLLPIRKSSGSI